MWSKGRRLTAVAQNGSYDITQYSYNADGSRTGKNRNGVVTEYILSGSRIVAEKRGSTVIRYWYDGSWRRRGEARSSGIGTMRRAHRWE